MCLLSSVSPAESLLPRSCYLVWTLSATPQSKQNRRSLLFFFFFLGFVARDRQYFEPEHQLDQCVQNWFWCSWKNHSKNGNLISQSCGKQERNNGLCFVCVNLCVCLNKGPHPDIGMKTFLIVPLYDDWKTCCKHQQQAHNAQNASSTHTRAHTHTVPFLLSLPPPSSPFLYIKT